jgi:predicted glutamine amidotransferase
MCLIVLKKKGVPLDASFLFRGLKQSAIRNSSGCGYAYKRDNKIALSKGHESVDEMIEELKRVGIRKSDELLVHLRNPSPYTGAAKPELCHPFVVTSNKEELDRKRYYGSKSVFAHNGKIDSDILYNSTDVYTSSDSYLFVKHVLSSPHFVDIMHLLYRNKNTNKTYKKLFGTNKFAILRPKYSASTFGDFVEDRNLLFSNDSYKSEVKPLTRTVFDHTTGKLKPMEPHHRYPID